MKEILQVISAAKPVYWTNPVLSPFEDVSDQLGLRFEDMEDAKNRLDRFAPLIKVLFPETDGIIESELTEIPLLKDELERVYDKKIQGPLLLKRDSELKIAGSVKARGGIYEVLKHAEHLAMVNDMLSLSDDYAILGDEAHRRFFSNYKIAVGSTGNLGLSIGIMGAALGFHVAVHMSKDAKPWKKTLLREKGVEVVEHATDYSKAVEAGRMQCAQDPSAYFVDDENSKHLFLGYSVAALWLKNQLEAKTIFIGNRRKLNVYLPCGVGGAPCGIAFGLKHVFGDAVRCYFAEPTHAPCMLLGLLTGKESVDVRDFGLDNCTEADGLAVGSPSKLAQNIVLRIADGAYTLEDDELFRLLALLYDTEGFKVEPSAAIGVYGALFPSDENTVHLVWATGGLLLPEAVYTSMYDRGKQLLKQDLGAKEGV